VTQENPPRPRHNQNLRPPPPNRHQPTRHLNTPATPQLLWQDARKRKLITTGTFTAEAKKATRDGAPPIDLTNSDRLSDSSSDTTSA
jgi:hypothetical protein